MNQKPSFEVLRYCWASDLCPLQLPLPHSFLYHAHHCWLSLLRNPKGPEIWLVHTWLPTIRTLTFFGLGTVPTTLYQTFRKELYIAWMLILQTWTGQDLPTYFETVLHWSHFKHRYGLKSRSKGIVAGLHYLNSSSLLFNDHIIGVIGNQGMVRCRLLMFCKFYKYNFFCCILLMFMLVALASLILDAPTIPLLVPVILVTLIFLLLDSPSSVFLTLFLPLSVMQLLSFLLPLRVFPLSSPFFVQALSFAQSILRFLISATPPPFAVMFTTLQLLFLLML